MRRRKNFNHELGFVEIGYIYVLVISALFFVSLTSLITDRIQEETENSVEDQLKVIGGKIYLNVNSVITQVNSNPNSRGNVNTAIPSTAGGYIYSISIMDDKMYINCSGTGTSIRYYLLKCNMEVRTYRSLSHSYGPLVSSYGSINIKYGETSHTEIVRISEGKM